MTDEERSRHEEELASYHEKCKNATDPKTEEMYARMIVASRDQMLKDEQIGVEWQKELDQKELREKEMELEREKMKYETIRTAISAGVTVGLTGLVGFMEAKGQYLSTAIRLGIDACKGFFMKGKR